jgi:hypothetical protein
MPAFSATGLLGCVNPMTRKTRSPISHHIVDKHIRSTRQDGETDSPIDLHNQGNSIAEIIAPDG